MILVRFETDEVDLVEKLIDGHFLKDGDRDNREAINLAVRRMVEAMTIFTVTRDATTFSNLP